MSEWVGGPSGSVQTKGLLAAIALASAVLTIIPAPPAVAAVRSPIPANQFGDPTLTFTDADAIYAYFTSDLAGGRI